VGRSRPRPLPFTFPCGKAQLASIAMEDFMLTFAVSGMTCQHCIAAVSRAVRALPGVQDVAVDLAAGRVVVQGAPDARAVRDAIQEEGYEARPT
jgi:copper chaperone